MIRLTRPWRVLFSLAIGACGQTAKDPATVAVDDAVTDDLVGAADHGGADQKANTGNDATTVEPGGSCEFSVSPPAHSPGSACETGADCESSFCVDTASSKVCTRQCIECCPTGFKCVQTSSGDAVFICLAKFTALCRPCVNDTECSVVNAGALCVASADAGSFCGGSCAADADCPTDYGCKQVNGSDGAAKQCVRTAGQCSCSAKAIADGAQTSCAVANGAGTCKGARKCAQSGLTACDAATPATETCNGKDDNCNGKTDENAVGCTSWYPDGDGDGQAAVAATPACLCAAAAPYVVAKTGDCDDADKGIHTDAAEICNGKDDDCDGKTDEIFADLDGDGLADCVDPDQDGDGSANAADCAPLDPAIYPTATEVCNGKDDNCNGKIDEVDATGCKYFWADGDSDGFGTADGTAKCLCKATDLYVAASGTDCQDGNAKINPAAKETCNGADDNCNSLVDEADAIGCTAFYADADQDGYGDADKSQCLCAPFGTYTTPAAGDCNDGQAKQNPSVQEACNELDDNCNGKIDEKGASGCTTFYADADGDTYGTDGLGVCFCKPEGIVSATVAGDCDDSKATVHPKAVETCNVLDDDCNGIVDDAGAVGCVAYYVDVDGDKFGSKVEPSKCLCAAAKPYLVTAGGDCADGDAAVYPGAPEVCNAKDDNCDGNIDEINAKGCKTFYMDVDGDGYGVVNVNGCICGPNGPMSALKAGDCNDKDPKIFPSSSEIDCDGIDQDCDGKDSCNQVCTTTAESFDVGVNGWLLNGKWSIAAWAASPGGGSGLGYGSGASYGGGGGTDTASKAIAVPGNAKHMNFQFKFGPSLSDVLALLLGGGDPSMDTVLITMGGVTVYSNNVAGWVDDYWHSYSFAVPGLWNGTVQTLTLSFSANGSTGKGFGFAVDDLGFSCN